VMVLAVAERRRSLPTRALRTDKGSRRPVVDRNMHEEVSPRATDVGASRDEVVRRWGKQRGCQGSDFLAATRWRGLHGPYLGPAGQRAWCAPATASGRHLPTAVEESPPDSHSVASLQF
jgi:hypothetical protein